MAQTGADPVGAAESRAQAQNQAGEAIDKRMLGVLPNYRTADGSAPFQAISPKQKFIIATKDSFDYPVFLTTAFFVGISHLQGDDNRLYGQGVKGFAHRYGIEYADLVLANYFPEAIVPVMFHMDPRYFRKGTGPVKSRLWYAMNRIFVCKTDRGRDTINAPELLGNAMAITLASSYHPHDRTIGDLGSEWGSIVASDMAGQVVREFYPDLKRLFLRSRHRTQP